MAIKKIPGLEHYPGSKEVNGTIQTIINLIPPHTRYYELFLGKGTVLLYKRPAAVTVGIDIDHRIIKLWRASTPSDIILECSDALQYIPTLWAANKNAFVYCDPPYPKTSRRSHTDIYDYEMTDTDHEKFLSLAIKVNCNCMISTYPNKLYSEILKDWHKVEFQSMTRGGPSTEVLYMNYPPPTELHDYRYLGKDCWDRQRIKRKIHRRIETLSKLPILEQRAIMQALNKKLSGPNS